MSAFHRIDDVRAMPAQRFIDFALRLVAYKGIVRALAEAEVRDEHAGQAPAAPTRSGGDISRNRTLNSDAATLRTDPAFAGMIEVRGGQDG